ncbi:ABC transporter substrate-binding protein [Plantibacter sp. Mn2098]|uniref:ABC transporter substrate-binding protein n=1 Tax=Plantibacter sp. Mn2098 TaxID=3395266 RepID=UPI003BD8632A
MSRSVLPSRPRLRHALPVVAAITASLVLSACSSTTPAASSDASNAATRTVTHELGTVTIPTAPKNIVALDEYAAMDLLSVGVKPTHVYRSLQSATSGAALEQTGTDLIDDPTFLTSPNIEALASLHPDVLVMSNTGPLVPVYQQLSEVAPVVALPFATDWRTIVGETGKAFGAEQAAEHVTKRLGAFEDEVASQVRQHSGTTSVLLGFQDMIMTPASDAPLSRLLADVGVTRPASEQNIPSAEGADATVPVSPEKLADHAADTTVVLSGGYYDPAVVQGAPTFAGTRVALADGDAWFGSHPFGIFWVLSDLQTLAGGSTALGTAADAAARWASFSALVKH